MERIILEQFLPYYLSVTSGHISDALSKVYSSHGLSVPEWRILIHLHNQDGLTPTELGVRTYMDKARVSRALAQMDHKKLVTRIIDPHDKRVAHIHLTETGQSLFDTVEPEVVAWDKRLRQFLADGQYEQLLETLRRLKEWAEQAYPKTPASRMTAGD